MIKISYQKGMINYSVIFNDFSGVISFYHEFFTFKIMESYCKGTRIYLVEEDLNYKTKDIFYDNFYGTHNPVGPSRFYQCLTSYRLGNHTYSLKKHNDILVTTKHRELHFVKAKKYFAKEVEELIA